MIYLEPRGNGLSDRPADETQMSSTNMAYDLEHLRKHLGLDPFPGLFGHSNGGCIALAYAAMYPERVEKLVLMDAEINGDTPSDNFVRWAGKRKDDPVYGPALQALMGARADPPQTDEAFTESMGKILPYYFNDVSKVGALVESMEVDVAPPRCWTWRGRLTT